MTVRRTDENATDIGASVRARLLSRAHIERRVNQDLLQHYALERFLYRLSVSAWSDSFLLKGALLLKAQLSQAGRATRDLDLLGMLSHDESAVIAAVRDICLAPVGDDGMTFNADSIDASAIGLQDEYSGVRVKFTAGLDGAVIPMQVDIGFGDSVFPGPVWLDYPVLLDFPVPHLRGYPLESIVAEKLEALLSLGLANSRLKDYFDLLMIARQTEFSGPTLAEAVRRTCVTRGTAISLDPPGLGDRYLSSHRQDWRALLTRLTLNEDESLIDFSQVLIELRAFLVPLLGAIVQAQPWAANWSSAGWTDPPR